MAGVRLAGVQKAFADVQVLRDINLDVRDGEFMVFVGPSGCGKSTLLRVIAGLEEITGGELSIGGRVVNEVPPAERGIAMVFQSYALFPQVATKFFEFRKAQKYKIDPDMVNYEDKTHPI